MYCTYANILARAGRAASYLTQTVVEELITDAGLEIDARLADRELANDEGDSTLKAACIELTLVRIFTRRRLDGTMPKSLSIGGLSMSDDIDTAIRQHQSKGDELVDKYVSKNTSMSTESDEREDLTMSDFHLDQSEVPNYRG
jgi:hypothetical protein